MNKYKIMRKKILLIILLAGSMPFLGCGHKSDSAEQEVVTATETRDAHMGEGDPDTVSLTEEQIKNIGIELGRIEEKQLTSSLKANGTLKVPNQNKASISSVYSGVIKSLLVQPGNTVKKGQLIAKIANPDFLQVQSQYLSVVSKISLAEMEVKRQRELNAGNAGALKNLQAAEAELKTLQTLKASLSQQIQLMGINPASISNGKLASLISLTSPINGVVSDVKVQMGSYVDASTVVAEVVDNSQLHLDLFVYEKDLPKLKNGQVIHFNLTNNPGKEYDAQIFSLGSSFEGESKAVSVHAKVLGDKTGLIDGMNITAAISLNKATMPAVPNDAIVSTGGRDYIFMLSEAYMQKSRQDSSSQKIDVIAKENVRNFEKIPVVKGTSDIGYTEITLLKEIPEDAKIVVKGAFFVLAKMTNTGEHDH
jgi:RND family efflux transporter MFP subunit